MSDAEHDVFWLSSIHGYIIRCEELRERKRIVRGKLRGLRNRMVTLKRHYARVGTSVRFGSLASETELCLVEYKLIYHELSRLHHAYLPSLAAGGLTLCEDFDGRLALLVCEDTEELC